MAGGDLLYIVAFIILPTAVLVSCIWALALLRSGRLLPARPVARYELASDEDLADDDLEDQPSPTEETGEHVVIAPAAAAPVVAVPVPAAIVAEERVPVTSTSAPVADQPPPAERTQEMAAVPVGEHAARPEPPDEPEMAEIATVADEPAPGIAPVAEVEHADEASSSDPASDLLLVPLDEPFRTDPNPAGELTRQNGASAVPAAVEDDEAAAITPTRRAPRRVGLPRPSSAGPTQPRPRTGQRRAARRSGGEG
jgi:hypothetical protein